MIILRGKARRLVARSWTLSWFYYRLHGVPLAGWPREQVWYFAYGANMHDRAFRERRRMRPVEQRIGRIRGYRLRFNLEGRPGGRPGGPAATGKFGPGYGGRGLGRSLQDHPPRSRTPRFDRGRSRARLPAAMVRGGGQRRAPSLSRRLYRPREGDRRQPVSALSDPIARRGAG